MTVLTDSKVSTITRVRPRSINIIAILMSLTIIRGFMVTMLPSLEMFGGVNPDAWLAPWVSDTILGILVPFMVYLLLSKRGILIWGILLTYNAIGAFDYLHGLSTQWTDPLIPDGIMGTPGMTFGSIGFSLLLQLTAIYLLLQKDVVSYLTRTR